jgi:nickel transport protein
MKNLTLFIALGLLIFNSSAMAHKVIVFAWVETGMIHIESSFGSNRPAKNCEIIIKTPEGTIVHQGLTDDQGLHALKIPDYMDSDLIVSLNAGPGHSGLWTIPKIELVGEATPENLEKKMAEKQSLEKGPSFARIVSGIAIIFGLALVGAWIKKKKSRFNA